MIRPVAFFVALVLVGCTSGTGSSPGDSGSEPGSTTPAGSSAASTPSTAGPTGGSSPGGMTCWSAQPAAGAGLTFVDQTESIDLVAPLTGMHGHAAAWGDVDDDGHVDLFVGTFADREADAYTHRGASGPSPDRLLLQSDDGSFEVTNLPEMLTRTSGSVFVDLDVDGDLDLVLARNWDDDDDPGVPATSVARNDGDAWEIVTIEAVPNGFGGRSIGVLDYNSDGLPDLVIAEDRFSGGRSVLLENLGGLAFQDVTQESGVAVDAHGLGVATADLTNDGHQDILITGSNRLFVARGDGSFQEASGAIPAWDVYGEEDDVAGVSVGDLNRDGYLDVVIGHHYNSTIDFGELVPIRVYMNRGPDGAGMPMLEDTTDESGLIGLPTKAPHVEINDMDNDGWPDLITTASAAGGTEPAVFRHLGLEDDVPIFEPPQGLGDAQYWVAGPTADVDRDGRLDLLLLEWEPSLPSLYLNNQSQSGNWLEVSVASSEGFGLGWRVEVYEAGRLGDPDSMLGAREITVTQGYGAGVAPTAHFGLGDADEVDIRLVPPGGVAAHDLPGVSGGQHIRFPDGCL